MFRIGLPLRCAACVGGGIRRGSQTASSGCERADLADRKRVQRVMRRCHTAPYSGAFSRPCSPRKTSARDGASPSVTQFWRELSINKCRRRTCSNKTRRNLKGSWPRAGPCVDPCRRRKRAHPACKSGLGDRRRQPDRLEQRGRRGSCCRRRHDHDHQHHLRLRAERVRWRSCRPATPTSPSTSPATTR